MTKRTTLIWAATTKMNNARRMSASGAEFPPSGRIIPRFAQLEQNSIQFDLYPACLK